MNTPKPARREAKGKKKKRVISPELRKIKSANMKKLTADPEIEARRRANAKKAAAEQTQESRDARRAVLEKTLSKPGVVRRMRKNNAKAQRTPEMRAAKSARKKKWWEGIRPLLDGPKAAAQTRNGRGAPKKTERNKRILELRSLHPDWDRGDIAREMDPDYDKLSTKKKENRRDAIRRVEERTDVPQKQEIPT